MDVKISSECCVAKDRGKVISQWAVAHALKALEALIMAHKSDNKGKPSGIVHGNH